MHFTDLLCDMKKEDLDKFYQNSVSYLQDKLNEPDLSVFLQTLEGDKLLKKLYFQLKDVWEYHQIMDEAAKVDLDIAWKEMAARHHLFEEEEVLPERKGFLNISRTWQVAASVAVLVGFGLLIGRFSSNLGTDDKLAHVFECPKGDMVKLNLSDGTAVWLNSDSKLIMSQNFSPKNRELSFVGEAFFNVSSDPSHPFRINVAGRQVEVKGTKFNIRYYPEEGLFQTSLEEGKVFVHTSKKLYELDPGQLLNINTKTGNSELQKTGKVELISAWRTGRLEFENMPMEQLMQSVERWHSHEVILEDVDLLDMKLSGVLKRNKGVEHFMKILSLAQPIKYKIKEDTIFISKMN